MSVWHYGTLKKYEFDVPNKVSIQWLVNLGPSIGIVRSPGIGLIHTELVSGIPVIFSHFVTNLPAFHQVLVFLCIKHVPVPHVRPRERFLVGRIGPPDFRLYRCIVRYGYRDAHEGDMKFEDDLVCSIAESIRTGSSGSTSFDEEEKEEKAALAGGCSTQGGGTTGREEDPPEEVDSASVFGKRVRFLLPDIESSLKALQDLTAAREFGIAYILGQCHRRAKPGSSLVKSLILNYAYEFLRRNSRPPTFTARVPHASSLEVGMVLCLG